MMQTLALVAIFATQALAQDAYQDPNRNNGDSTAPLGDGYSTNDQSNQYTAFQSDSYVPSTTLEVDSNSWESGIYSTTAEGPQATQSSPSAPTQPDYVQIKYKQDLTKCLAILDTSLQNPTPVVLKDCESSGHESHWLIDQTEPSRVKSRVYQGQDWCLDAGDASQQVQTVGISPCNDVNPAQIWLYTSWPSQHLVVYNEIWSLDLTDGNATGGGQFQTWAYSLYNPHQEWQIDDASSDPMLEGMQT